MFLSTFAIKRPVVTITVMVALVAFGIAALLRLQTDEFPDVQQPVVAVTISYPGASPDVVEREIVDPIEDSFSTISGIDWGKTTSTSTDGLAQFVVAFDFEKDIQQASQDIRDAISTKREDLPEEMKEPVLSRLDPGDLPVLSLTLTSTTVSPATLTRIADPGIVRDLRSVPGVGDVSVVGGIRREMTVQVRPADLQANGVSVADVVQAVGQQNLAAPVGRLNGPLEEQAIRLKGRLDDAQDFANLVVAQRNGQVIRLGQVADVFDGTEEARTSAIFNGKDAVGIDIKKSKGYSTTRVSADILERVATIEKTLPASVKPNTHTAMKDASTLTGSASPVITVERQELRNMKTTSTVSSAPSMSASSTFITACDTRSPASCTTSSFTPAGSVFSIVATRSRISALTRVVL